MKTQYTGPQGQLNLFFGNKASQPLERLLCNLPPSPQFQWQMGALPQRIEAKKQTVVSHIYIPTTATCCVHLDVCRCAVGWLGPHSGSKAFPS